MRRAIRALPVAALALVTLLFLPQKLDAHAQRWMVSSFYRARTDVYLTLARWIKDVRLADVSVLMHEPGYFAYWSGSPMIDAAGLITKGIYYHGPEERRTKPDDIVRVHRPGLIVTPPLYWMGLTLDDYLPLYYPVPTRTLYVRRSIFTERFPALAEHWLARDAYHPDHPALLHHPLHWNFERAVDSGWVTGGSITDFVGQPRAVQFGRRPVTEDYLNTAGPRSLWASLSSPPFVIDFDEISFRFGGTDRHYTRARFIVDGQIVLEQAWRRQAPAPDARRVLAGVELEGQGRRLAVRRRRHRGRLPRRRSRADRPLPAVRPGGRLRDRQRLRRVLGDRVRRRRRPISSRWRSSAASPCWSGRRAALSRGAGGDEPIEMRSRPFTIDRDALSFLAFDFGGPGTRIELRVGGEVKRSWSGGQTEHLQGVVWGVKALKGQQAVLAVVDETPGDAEWVGVDDVAAFDRAGAE